MKFSKAKCKALRLGSKNPMYRCRLETDCLEISLAEKDLGGHTGQQVEHEPANTPLWQSKPAASWVVLGWAG